MGTAASQFVHVRAFGAHLGLLLRERSAQHEEELLAALRVLLSPIWIALAAVLTARTLSIDRKVGESATDSLTRGRDRLADARPRPTR